MPSLVTRTVPELPTPDPALVAEALAAAQTGKEERHDAFAARLDALNAIEQVPPATLLAWPGRITVAAFNVERLTQAGAVRALLDAAGASATLLSEVDVGMARSGNRHGMRELTRPAGEGYVFGVEFVELTLGDPLEQRAHAGQCNARSFHGNGIASRLALADATLIPLDEGGHWFAGWNGAQQRIGGRVAIAARVADAPRPLWLVSVHLESKTDPEDRAAQVRRLIDALDRIAHGAAAVIGGDFNTKDLPMDDPAAWLDEPERHEPLFAALRGAGFDWRAANVAAPTQRTGPSGNPRPPFHRLDWIFTRGVEATNPRVVPALDGEGRPISDHEMVTAEIVL